MNILFVSTGNLKEVMLSTKHLSKLKNNNYNITIITSRPDVFEGVQSYFRKVEVFLMTSESYLINQNKFFHIIIDEAKCMLSKSLIRQVPGFISQSLMKISINKDKIPQFTSDDYHFRLSTPPIDKIYAKFMTAYAERPTIHFGINVGDGFEDIESDDCYMTKRLPTSLVVKIIQMIKKRFLMARFYIFGDFDNTGFRSMCYLSNENLIDMRFVTHAQDIAQAIDACSIFISPDTGYAHIAAATGDRLLLLAPNIKQGTITENRSNVYVVYPSQEVECCPCDLCYGLCKMVIMEGIQCFYFLEEQEIMKGINTLLGKGTQSNED